MAFFLRIRPSGVISYGALSRLGRKGNKIGRLISNEAAYSPKQAREVAKEWLVQFDQGLNPKATHKGAMTPLQLLEQYIASKSLKPRTESDYRCNFQHYLKPLKHGLMPISRYLGTMVICFGTYKNIASFPFACQCLLVA